jgi:hypothetical protein
VGSAVERERLAQKFRSNVQIIRCLTRGSAQKHHLSQFSIAGQFVDRAGVS